MKLLSASIAASSLRRWLPSRGNLVFTLLVLASLFFAGRAGALPDFQPDAPDAPSTSVIAYQGRLADAAGVPLTGNYGMTFALYSASTGGTALWTESRTVAATDGLFSVMLGEVTPIPASLAANTSLFLGVRVGSDAEMTPRKQLGSVGYAFQAITVPDGSITTAKLQIDADVDLRGYGLINAYGIFRSAANPLYVRSYGDDAEIRMLTDRGIKIFMDANNNNSDSKFYIYRNDHFIGGNIATVFSVQEDGYVDVTGTLNMHGNPIINQGSIVEAGLQTPDEIETPNIERFTNGDVLCFIEGHLELCAEMGDRRIIAVANDSGKPVVLGVHQIKVIGKVQPGDLLVASAMPGFAIATNEPSPGTVIAKALEPSSEDQGMVKAMINTP